ncbi:MAG: DUF3298 and DUF4163 domain-containing protein [Alcaligenaceae bacterium]|nr:DUF3298 and DUF4163 domain-containing protein [Alcaligenaceae bacterium]
MKKIFYLILSSFLSTSLMAGTALAQTAALSFETVEIEKHIQLLDDGDETSPNATFELTMNYPNHFKNKQDLKSLQQLITAKVLGDDYANHPSLDAAIASYVADYEHDYRDNLNDFFGDDLTEQLTHYPIALFHFNKINHTIDYQNDHILSFTVDHWVHQGGAHGLGTEEHYSINLQSIEELTLSQLMKPGYEAELTEIVKQNLLQIKADKFKAYQADLSQLDEQTLKESFFNYDEITLPDNFMLTDMGLAFTYNPYDIDAFASGSFKVDISYAEVAHLMKQSVLQRLLPEIDLQTASSHFDFIDVSYDGYRNSRYDFMVQYPDFLIPQGESESGDGQRFISSDGHYVMSVYRDFKALTGENPSLQEAYYAESDSLPNILYNQLNDNYYWYHGKVNRTRHYQQFTYLIQDEYFTLYLEYPLAAETTLQPIIEHVAASFSAIDTEIGAMAAELSDEFLPFLHEFLEATFWEKNLNTLLRDNNEQLSPYLDPGNDVRRYHSPGAVPHLYSRADNFGFNDLTDFTSSLELSGENSYVETTPDMSVCDLDFERLGPGLYTIYFAPSAWEFTALVNPETFDFAPIPSPYPDATVMQVYVPAYYKGFVNPRGLYFIQSPDGWKLMFVDDSLCGA